MSISLEEKIGISFQKRQETLSTAESCTGGRIAARLVGIPGASEYFIGGVVAYSNASKADLLACSKKELQTHGAVSKIIAYQMARNARRRFHTDWGLAVTGISGPSGGSLAKPVGTVYIGVSGPSRTIVKKLRLSGHRRFIQQTSATQALKILQHELGREAQSRKGKK